MFLLMGVAAALGSAAVSKPPICLSFVGKSPPTTTFKDVLNSLPVIPSRGEYETTASYDARVAAASVVMPPVVVIQQHPARNLLSFNADKGQLVVYGMDLGQDEFRSLPTVRGSGDSQVAFVVETNVVDTSEYAATNAYGAQANVILEKREVLMVWERSIKLGKPVFEGAKSRGPVALIPMQAAIAQNVIERGSTAILLVPKPPYVVKGSETLGPTFRNPRERRDDVTALTADIQCSFILNSGGTVIAAFSVI